MGLRAAVLSAVFFAVLCGNGIAADIKQPTKSEAGRLRHYLATYLADRGQIAGEGTRLAWALTDLDNDGAEEAIVYVTGPEWCGSGGCRTLVLTPTTTSYRVVMSASVTRLPIRLLPTASHGWRDIAVGVSGGGATPGQARLSFDGRKYPANPTVPPARRSGRFHGPMLIDVGAKGEPL